MGGEFTKKASDYTTENLFERLETAFEEAATITEKIPARYAIIITLLIIASFLSTEE